MAALTDEPVQGKLAELDLGGGSGSEDGDDRESRREKGGVEEAGQAGVHSLPAHMRDLDGASLGDSLKLTRARLGRKKKGDSSGGDGGDRVRVQHPTFRDLSVSTEAAESKREGSAGVTFDSAEVVHSPSITKSLTSKLSNATDSMKLHRVRRKVPHADAASVLAPPAGSRLSTEQSIGGNSGSAAIPGHVQNLADRLANTTDSMQMNRRRLSRDHTNAASALKPPEK